MLIRGVQESERGPLLDLLELCFDERALFERYLDFDPAFRWNDFAAAECDGRIVACAQVFHKKIRLAGTVISVGGIGSVATHPDYRGRGLAREILLEREQYMREAGCSLGLLFTGIPEVYSKLGWVALPLRQFRIEFGAGSDEDAFRIRAFEAADLDAVRALFEAYASRFEGAIVRDAAYWTGQLRYAGNPDEDFRVLETRGQIAAYARCAALDPGTVVLEHAYLPGAEAALCRLLRTQLAGQTALLRLPADAELEAVLQEEATRFQRDDDQSPMWRALQVPELRRLTGDSHASETALLTELIEKRGAHYWSSDRF